jgi:hypothetical protein
MTGDAQQYFRCQAMFLSSLCPLFHSQLIHDEDD